MTTTRIRIRIADLSAALLLVLAPIALLGSSLFGDKLFMPSDPARFPPASLTLTEADRHLIESQRSNDDVTEVPFLVIPELELAEQELRNGRFPGWNPYARFGAPLFANGLAGIAYPPNWLLLLSPDPAHGLGLSAYLAYLIAGVAMFAFLRSARLRTTSALLGALAFMLSGTLTANAHFYMRMNALVWLPAMLLACLRLSRAAGAARLVPTLGLALTTAMEWLAGFPPFAIASTVFAGLYALSLVCYEARSGEPRRAARMALWIGSGFALGLALAAVQLGPALAYFPESSRNLVPPANSISRGGFDPSGFLGYFMPTAFGEPDGSSPSAATSPLALALQTRIHWTDSAPAKAGELLFPSNFNFTEYAVFIGILPLLLAVIGLFGGISRLRFRLFGIAAVLTLVATSPSWLSWVYDLPGAPKTPMRWIGPVCVAIAGLAAVGFEAVVSGRARRVSAVLSGVAISAGICCAIVASSGFADHDFAPGLAERYSHFLEGPDGTAQLAAFVGQPNLLAAGPRLESSLWRAAWTLGCAGVWLGLWLFAHRRSRRLFDVMQYVTIGLVAVELVDFGRVSNVTREMPVSTETEVQQFLREQRDARAASGGVAFMRAAAAPKTPIDLPSGLTFPDRIRDITAYAFSDPWSHRLFEAEYGKGQMYREVWPNAFPDDARLSELPLFDLIGVHYVLSAERLAHAGKRVGPTLRRTESDDGAVTEPREFFIYERPNPLPRSFFVQELDVREDDTEVIAAMLAPDLDPTAAVIVTPTERAKLPDPAGGTRAARRVSFVRDLPNDILLEVAPGEAGYLVLSDACLSGWSATVNGEPTPITRGNLFMRVVPVGSRGAEVRFRYDPPGLKSGITITMGALILLMLGVVSWRRSSRPKAARAESSI